MRTVSVSGSQLLKEALMPVFAVVLSMMYVLFTLIRTIGPYRTHSRGFYTAGDTLRL